MIIVEGIDGAGKSRIIEYLAEKLKSETPFPPFVNSDDFFIQNFNKYKDTNAILHRFHLSQLVYSKTLRNNDMNTREFEDKIFGGEINKSILILVDIDPDEAYERIIKRDNKREKQNLFVDRTEFLRRYTESKMRHFYIYNKDWETTKTVLDDIICLYNTWKRS